MDEKLKKAHKLIFDQEPEELTSDWELAEKVLDSFDFNKLGEDLAKECIFRIVNHVSYPNAETRIRIVGRAEGFASEIWDDMGDEPHMAEIERKEFWHNIEKKQNNK